MEAREDVAKEEIMKTEELETRYERYKGIFHSGVRYSKVGIKKKKSGVKIS